MLFQRDRKVQDQGAADLVSDASWLSASKMAQRVMISCDRWAKGTNAVSSLSGRDEGKAWAALFPKL